MDNESTKVSQRGTFSMFVFQNEIQKGHIGIKSAAFPPSEVKDPGAWATAKGSETNGAIQMKFHVF